MYYLNSKSNLMVRDRQERSRTENLFGLPVAHRVRTLTASILGSTSSLALPYSMYEPNPTNLEPFGIDLSIYNGTIDYTAMSLYERVRIRYSVSRAGISWGYEDPTFVKNWIGVYETEKIDPQAYWVIHVDQGIFRQVNKCISVLEKVPWANTSKILWIDLELHKNRTRSQVMSATWQFIQTFMNLMAGKGWTAGVYSGRWFLDAFGEYQSWVDEIWWWLAHYMHPQYGIEHPGPPSIPHWLKRSKVAIHQAGSYYNGVKMFRPSGGNQRSDGNRLELGSPYPAPFDFLNQSQPGEFVDVRLPIETARTVKEALIAAGV